MKKNASTSSKSAKTKSQNAKNNDASLLTNSLSKKTGVAIPLGALYTKESPVIGEFTSLKPFADFCKNSDLTIIQLLPVNDTGTQSSPYSGLSAFALHPIFINISALKEFDELYSTNSTFQKKYDDFVKNHQYKNRFNYQEILNAKTELLRDIFYSTKVDKEKNVLRKAIFLAEFSKFIEENPWVKEYSVYKNLKWQNMQASWKSWKKADKKLSQDEIENRFFDKEKILDNFFYVWTQIRAEEQFLDAANYVKSKGIILKGDMPILMNEDSCDAWAHPEIFNHDLRAGNPVDGENPAGQNWGFPTYNWKNLKKQNYQWWQNRLKTASQFYDAYRLDHILGFFRIWAIPERDSTAILGHSEPYKSIGRKELNELGFTDERLRWLSQPHIRICDIDYFTWNNEKSREVLSLFAEEIESKEFWLFKKSIKGDRDFFESDLSKIVEPQASDGIKQKLSDYWNNRTLLEIEKDTFIPIWTYEKSYAWETLSEEEKNILRTLFEQKNLEQNKLWEKQATEILSALTSSNSMQACGEDLGVNLECVPRVMKKQNILGLNVVRWSREWQKENQPFVDFKNYRELSVTTTSVHDSSTLRQWWQDEFDSALNFVQYNIEDFSNIISKADFENEMIDYKSSNFQNCENENSQIQQKTKPTAFNDLKNFTPEIAENILSATSKSASVWNIHPLQDFLYMDQNYWLVEPSDERVNVPGSVNEFNWTYRMPCSVEEILENKNLIKKIKNIAKRHDEA